MESELPAEVSLALAIYLSVLFAGSIAALVFQFIDDFRNKRSNPLPVWNLRWSEAIALGWGGFFGTLLVSVVLSALCERYAPEVWQIALQTIGWQIGLLFVPLLMMRLYPRYFSIRLSPDKVPLLQAVKEGVLQFVVAIILLGLTNLIWHAVLKYLGEKGFGDFMDNQEIVDLMGSDMPTGVYLTMVFGIVILAPLCEEIIFRGFLYRFLKAKFSPRMAMIVSSVCFGLIHFNVLNFIALTLLGMLLVRAYERTGSLRVPILIHAFFNANTLLFMYLSPDLMGL